MEQAIEFFVWLKAIELIIGFICIGVFLIVMAVYLIWEWRKLP
jgi:hypothetical protein